MTPDGQRRTPLDGDRPLLGDGDRSLALGVIGLGQWGRHHLRILTQLPGVDLVGVVDPDAREARLLAHRYGTRPYTDHRDLLGNVEGVVIAAPTVVHYEIARDFLQAGVHVLVEKPITTTVDDAARLVALAAERDRVLLVGHIERFKPAVQRACSLVRDPLAIAVRRLRPFDARRTMDVGVIMDLMIHDIDIASAMVPGRFEDLRAIGVTIRNSHEDLAVAHLRTDGGCVVTLTASRVAATKAADMEITMADGAIHLDFLRQTVNLHSFRGEESRRIVLDGQETLRLELAHFLDCIRGDAEPLVTGQDGLRALGVAQDLQDRMIRISPPLRV